MESNRMAYILGSLLGYLINFGIFFLQVYVCLMIVGLV
jgi:hypothetical protein